MTALRMNVEELDAFLEQSFPQARKFGTVIERLDPGVVRVRWPVGDDHLRPGGTVSGPTLMTLADTAFYYLVLAMIGPVELTVTTHLSIDFLRRPAPVDVIAVAEMLKLGRRLAVGRVTMHSDGDERAIAHATVTYSIPPQREVSR